MKMNELINKGQKRVDTYMRGCGYELYDCIETDTGYEAEWVKTHAGITLKTVTICFSKSWRVVSIK